MKMMILEDPSLRASQDDVVFHNELDDLKLIFYIVCGVFAVAILVLIGSVIGLFAWVQRISIAQKKNTNTPAFSTRSLGRTLKPQEELSKRYTMSIDDDHNVNRSPNLDRNPFSRQASYKKPEPDILGNVKHKKNKSVPGPSKHPDKRGEPHTSVPVDGMHFVEDRLRRDELYY